MAKPIQQWERDEIVRRARTERFVVIARSMNRSPCSVRRIVKRDIERGRVPCSIRNCKRPYCGTSPEEFGHSFKSSEDLTCAHCGIGFETWQADPRMCRPSQVPLV